MVLQDLISDANLSSIICLSPQHKMRDVLGFEVNKPSKIFIKKSSTTKYIEMDIQKIEAPRIEHQVCMRKHT